MWNTILSCDSGNRDIEAIACLWSNEVFYQENQEEISLTGRYCHFLNFRCTNNLNVNVTQSKLQNVIVTARGEIALIKIAAMHGHVDLLENHTGHIRATDLQIVPTPPMEITFFDNWRAIAEGTPVRRGYSIGGVRSDNNTSEEAFQLEYKCVISYLKYEPAFRIREQNIELSQNRVTNINRQILLTGKMGRMTA